MEREDGSFFLALGGSGGSRIFGALFQVLLNLDWGLNLSDAIEFGRLHDQLFPLRLDADDVYPPDILKDLKWRGHNITGEAQKTLVDAAGLDTVFNSVRCQPCRCCGPSSYAGRRIHFWYVFFNLMHWFSTYLDTSGKRFEKEWYSCWILNDVRS
jgi:hypothetical protein